VRRQLLAQRPRHAPDRGLHQVVEERDAVVLGVVLVGAVVDLDDQTAGRADQQRQRDVARDGVGLDPESQQPQPDVEVGLPDGGVPLHGRGAEDVVDEDVERTLLVLDAPDERRDLVGDEVVDLDGDADAAGGVDQLGGLLDGLGPRHLRGVLPGGSPGDVDGGAGRPELDGDAPARPPGPAGHEGDLAGQRPAHRTTFS
jgi:hypothetical protein